MEECASPKSLIEAYYKMASECYKDCPDQLSPMVLVIIELWIASDAVAVGLLPLLGVYDPEVNPMQPVSQNSTSSACTSTQESARHGSRRIRSSFWFVSLPRASSTAESTAGKPDDERREAHCFFSDSDLADKPITVVDALFESIKTNWNERTAKKVIIHILPRLVSFSSKTSISDRGIELLLVVRYVALSLKDPARDIVVH